MLYLQVFLKQINFQMMKTYYAAKPYVYYICIYKTFQDKHAPLKMFEIVKILKLAYLCYSLHNLVFLGHVQFFVLTADEYKLRIEVIWLKFELFDVNLYFTDNTFQ